MFGSDTLNVFTKTLNLVLYNMVELEIIRRV